MLKKAASVDNIPNKYSEVLSKLDKFFIVLSYIFFAGLLQILLMYVICDGICILNVGEKPPISRSFPLIIDVLLRILLARYLIKKYQNSIGSIIIFSISTFLIIFPMLGIPGILLSVLTLVWIIFKKDGPQEKNTQLENEKKKLSSRSKILIFFLTIVGSFFSYMLLVGFAMGCGTGGCNSLTSPLVTDIFIRVVCGLFLIYLFPRNWLFILFTCIVTQPMLVYLVTSTSNYSFLIRMLVQTLL